MNRFVVLIVTVMVFSLNLFAQESLRNQLFTEVDNTLKKAKLEMADIFSPQNFKQAMEYYNEAQSSLKKGGNIQKIRKNINGANAHLVKAHNFADLAKLTFVTAIESRQAAMDAAANLYASELWIEAEERFEGAMEEMENNDLEDAKEEAAEAETLYRKAELKAIKVDLVGPAKELLKKAEDMDSEDYAPISLKKAKQASFEVEKLLEENRYAQEEGFALAKTAKYHAQHTIFLTKTIKNLKDKDNALEEVLLFNEKNLNELADQLDVTLDFSEGYGQPLNTLILAVQELQESNEKQLQDLNSVHDRVAMMEEQMGSMENRLGKYTEAEEELQQKIALKKEQENKVRNLSANLSKQEGQVFLDGDNVIIRLYGLTFPTGKTEIKPKFFALLRKVQDGIREFENCEVVIEGHTDSRGGAKLNQRLSEQRAAAVKEYLVANMNFPSTKMKVVGFGESKPVANNEIKIGRAKNRRIDVLIIPKWAQK